MRNFAIVLLLGFAAVPTSAVRITLDSNVAEDTAEQKEHQVQGNRQLEEQTEDATKPEFAMPTFDDLSRARVTRLTELGMVKSTAQEVVKKYAADKRGINKANWEDANVESKLKAFLDVQGAKVKSNKGKIDFDYFVKMNLEIELVDAKTTDGTFPKKFDKRNIAKWLSTKPRKYWSRFGGAKLADSFLSVNKKSSKCSDFDGCDLWTSLLRFVEVDSDSDGSLNFADLADHLPTDRSSPRLAWDSVAHVEDMDLKTLKLPSKLRTSILKVAGTETKGIFGSSFIDSAAWNKFSLQPAVTEFIKRDQRPRVEGKMDDVSGEVRFHQIADIIPWPKADEAHMSQIDEHNNLKHKIGGWVKDIHVPTFEEVSGRSQGLEMSAKDIETWLKKEEQGMNNNWSFGIDNWKHAKRMSEDVLHWGDGSIPDTPQRPGFTNERIQGPAGGEDRDQWTDVAPRLAVFLHLDSDHDGEIDFKAAYPYIKAALDEA